MGNGAVAKWLGLWVRRAEGKRGREQWLREIGRGAEGRGRGGGVKDCGKGFLEASH